MEDNQMQAAQIEEEKKTLENEKELSLSLHRILPSPHRAVGGLSQVFTGSSNNPHFVVPADPPGESEAYRWNAKSGLELMVEVRQHIQKKKRRNPS
jgi:hypothetical protein